MFSYTFLVLFILSFVTWPHVFNVCGCLLFCFFSSLKSVIVLFFINTVIPIWPPKLLILQYLFSSSWLPISETLSSSSQVSRSDGNSIRVKCPSVNQSSVGQGGMKLCDINSCDYREMRHLTEKAVWASNTNVVRTSSKLNTQDGFIIVQSHCWWMV